MYLACCGGTLQNGRTAPCVHVCVWYAMCHAYIYDQAINMYYVSAFSSSNCESDMVNFIHFSTLTVTTIRFGKMNLQGNDKGVIYSP
jgi:hypothetical protein